MIEEDSLAPILSPRTPEKVEKIPRDDSFKTCKTTVLTPRTRINLRNTPLRESIASGNKPFKENTPTGKRFNLRRRPAAKKPEQPDARASVLEQKPRIHERPRVPERTKILEKAKVQQQQQAEKKPKSKNIINDMDDNGNLSDSSTSTNDTFIKPSPAVQAIPKVPVIPIGPPISVRNKRFITPMMTNTFRKPASLRSTSSRYLNSSQWNNNSTLIRANSFRSTAELERDYFKSLRSS